MTFIDAFGAPTASGNAIEGEYGGQAAGGHAGSIGVAGIIDAALKQLNLSTQ
jgi:hypothetical protein